jgi:hypothetical protein
MALFTFLDASYLFPIGKKFSIGIGNTFAIEYGHYEKAGDIFKWTNNIGVFGRWSFL